MPEQIRCPECEATLRVPDNLLGKAVKCPKCETTFTAELDAPEARERIVREPAKSAPSRRPSRPPEEEPDEEVPEEEEQEEDRPRRRKRRRGRRREQAEVLLAGPAIALMIVGSLDIFLGVLNLLLPVLGVSILAASGKGNAAGNSDLMANLVSGVFSGILDICFGGVILAGAIQMKKVSSFGLAMTACILAMLPCWNCCLLGLPFGIWGLVMLNKPEVKDAFS